VTIVTGMQASMGRPGITVGTADRLQGGEWSAVVALDPIAGGISSEHHTSVGRLCVMGSRHSAHLTWVHDGTWEQSLSQSMTGTAGRASLKVRRALCQPVSRAGAA